VVYSPTGNLLVTTLMGGAGPDPATGCRALPLTLVPASEEEANFFHL
jgi:hypothetical protein